MTPINEVTSGGAGVAAATAAAAAAPVETEVPSVRVHLPSDESTSPSIAPAAAGAGPAAHPGAIPWMDSIDADQSLAINHAARGDGGGHSGAESALPTGRAAGMEQ